MFTSIIKKQTNFSDKKSISYILRNKRSEMFKSFAAKCDNKKLNIIDVGGTQDYWNSFYGDKFRTCNITLINLTKETVNKQNFKSVIGSGTDMKQFNDKEFDIVFSNSVIEHVGNYDEQMKMANEVKRVGQRFFLQTPNKYFPMEPHFLILFFQFIPVAIRIFLLTHFRVGWLDDKVKDKKVAKEIAQSIRLLSKRELEKLFPNSNIYEEKLFGLTKSFIVYSK